MSDQLQVLINGSIYSGWKEVEILKDIEAISGTYKISMSVPEIYTLNPGQVATLKIAGLRVIEGYIDKVRYSIDPSNQVIEVIGRDYTGDLVDSSAVTSVSEYLNISYKRLCQTLLSPFGISFRSETTKADSKIEKVSFQQETVFEVLEREARKLGLLIYPDLNGSLVIAEVSSRPLNTRLTLPGNLIGASTGVDYSNRFSEYLVKGQQASKSILTVKQSNQVSAKATDKNIERHRPLIVLSESTVNLAEAQKRVQWEASVRASRSEILTVKVPGWTDKDAALWEVNRLVSTRIDPVNFNSDMLIKSVSFRYNETEGQTTELTLVDPEIYIPKPVIEKKATSKRILPE